MPEILMISECLICKKVYKQETVNISDGHNSAGKDSMISHGYCCSKCANIGSYGRDDSDEIKPKEIENGSL